MSCWFSDWKCIHYQTCTVPISLLLWISLTYRKNVWVFAVVLADYMSRLEQQHFTISEVAADWHELVILRCIMHPSIARDGEQLDPRCSTQTYHRPNQPHYAFTMSYYSFPVPLRVGG